MNPDYIYKITDKNSKKNKKKILRIQQMIILKIKLLGD